MKRRTWLVLSIVAACAAAGACRSGNEAKFGGQIKGKQVTVGLGVTRAGDLEVPSATVWNDTGGPLPVHPIKMQGWYKSGATETSATEPGDPLPPNSSYIFPGLWRSRGGECLERVRVEVSTGGGGEAFVFHRGEACP
ncbi:MAG: hypothetical protein ACRD4T_06845 [Candidatus Acidiferrales bacterium]